MWVRLALFILMFLCLSIWSKGPNTVKLTNIECIPNPEWVKETNCSLKYNHNRKVTLYVRTVIIQLVKTVTVKIQMFRWHNGFRPFIFDFVYDGCEAHSGKNTLNPVSRTFSQLLVKHSNLNHPCPYYGEVIVPSLEPDLEMIPSLIPTGTYRLTLTFIEKENNIKIFTLNVKGLISSELVD